MMRATWLLVLLAAWSPSLLADERILSYDSDIEVHESGSMVVTETIRVRAEGRQIKRGIYRDFPTDYKTPSGVRVRVDFDVIGVERDGVDEAWHTQGLANGVRVYIGRKDVMLRPGEYTYRLRYLTNRQLGFFEQHDELYWNVTGNGWDFPINSATARVHLPPGVPAGEILHEAYTGAQGERGSQYRSGVENGVATFATTAPLARREGLTVAVRWPKGFVHEPTRADRLRWIWQDDRPLIVLWGGTLVLLAWYLFAWHRVGRDPAEGLIIPEYEPPADYSPAAVRMVRNMGFDDKALSAALVSMAVKGAITIHEDDEEYEIRPTGNPPKEPLAPGEQAVLKVLGSVPLAFKQSNHERVKRLKDAHRDELKARYEKSHFYSNTLWLVPGWLLTAVIAAYALVSSIDGRRDDLFIPAFVMVWFGVFAMPFLTAAWRLRLASGRGAKQWLALVGPAAMLVFALFFAGSFLRGTSPGSLPWGFLLGAALLATVNLLFGHLMKAPTAIGRKLLDRVEGFRQYLAIAESDELKFKYAKKITPEIFEAYLPYAIALDVETQWSERFAATLRAAGQAPTQYGTTWYHGRSFSGVRGISSSVSGALASSVSSSSHAPGSSSGGGGGGFSGGGGGGGGGGGW